MNNPISPETFAERVPLPSLSEVVDEAARAVAPLWPLEAAIAVNPLSGMESLPFREALERAASRFGSAASLPLPMWRELIASGRIHENALRDAATNFLGGLDQAFAPIGPDVCKLDLLMARLLHLEESCLGASATPSPVEALVAKWCAAFFSPPSGRMMRHRSEGLYRAVLPLLAFDREFLGLSTDAKSLCSSASKDPLDALSTNLDALGCEPAAYSEMLERLVARLPGWAGHVRWRSEHAEPDLARPAPVSMVDYLALWTLILRAKPAEFPTRKTPCQTAEEQLADHFGLSGAIEKLPLFGRRAFEEVARLSQADLGLLFVTAAENRYRDALVESMRSRQTPVGLEPASAQLVFCIDVRSEPYRRALESIGPYATYGYAGFFGVAMALRPIDESAPQRQLPVLFQPQYQLAEVAARGREGEARAAVKRNASFQKARATFNASKLGVATSFSTADAGGLAALAAMLFRTLTPSFARRSAARLGRGRDQAALAPAPANTGMTLNERLECAKGLFTLTGLPAEMARLVLLVGHRGSATNNPFAGALDCGACGGHQGGPNARVLADILNCPLVRDELAQSGIRIPVDSLFVAAEHDTTTDVVSILDGHLVPETHRTELGRLADDLAEAGASCRAERAKKLGCEPKDLATRAAHWGEVRPEWGLAGNAAFIVGPRGLTRHMSLEGRAFLHSYDWEKDPDGAALETILTAPLIVAQWINCQYLFSTLDNERFGAGDKITHNVLGGIGVVQGNGLDLRVGLPRQSLFGDDGLPYHVPQRLLAVVEAPLERIEAIVDRHPMLSDLLDNEWIHLIALDPINGSSKKWRAAASQTVAPLMALRCA